MKKINYQQILKNGLLTLAAYTIVFSIAACDNKNNNQPATQNVYQNCVNCGMMQGQIFFKSTSTSYNSNVNLSLNFVGNTAFNNYYQYGASPVVTYHGPTAATGTLHINVMANIDNCIIPAGDYTVQTTQAGQWASGVISQLRLTAVGPSQVNMLITSGQVSAKQYTDMGKLWTEIPQIGNIFANVMIESVGGVQCYRSVLMQ